MRRFLPTIALALVCLVAGFALAGCGGDDDGDSTTTETFAADTTTTETTETETDGTTTVASGAVGCTEVTAPPAGEKTPDSEYEQLDPSKSYAVVIDTNCGSFTIDLDVEQSPETTASFVSLVNQGYFDETVFHRIVPGFVIQGGDPTASGAGGPGYSTTDTPPSDAKYTHGVVAMAKTQDEAPGTSGSQFFVVTATDAALPPDYAVIGTVTDGLDVVDAIGALGGPDELPTQTVEIEKATVNES